jgi:hypothetical protein
MPVTKPRDNENAVCNTVLIRVAPWEFVPAIYGLRRPAPDVRAGLCSRHANQAAAWVKTPAEKASAVSCGSAQKFLQGHCYGESIDFMPVIGPGRVGIRRLPFGAPSGWFARKQYRTGRIYKPVVAIRTTGTRFASPRCNQGRSPMRPENAARRHMMIANNNPKDTFPTAGQTARRQAHIRDGWSPWERRERARQASVQIHRLWSMIQSANPPANPR